MNVFVAGFHHETNTFAPSFADWAAFEAGGGYPSACHGAAMLAKLQGGSLAVAGFVARARERGWALLPSLWAGAMPSNRVTAAAFEHIATTIVADLRAALAAGRVDAVYLDLHGAAVAEGADDAEGELLERIRVVTGAAMPIVASLDLHANVTERMLLLATAMTAYRTYPHVDMRETGGRAADMLAARLADLQPRTTIAERVPFLLPLNAQCTLMQPAADVIALLQQLEAEHEGIELNFAMGFSAADFAECGPVLFGHGHDEAAVRSAVHRLQQEVVARRGDWTLDLLAPTAAVEHAIVLSTDAVGPVVIADTQDNPGAGGDANTTGMLHALIAARAGVRLGGQVALGLMFDPAAAAAACAAGVGSEIELVEMTIGRAVPAWTGARTDAPWQGRCRVTAVSDGVVPLHGPMTAGATAQLGPCACVEIDGIRVLLASTKAQMLDLDLFRFLGVEPDRMRLLVVKSSVHFRAAFAPIASHILVAKALGPMAADPGDLPWQHLPPGMASCP